MQGTSRRMKDICEQLGHFSPVSSFVASEDSQLLPVDLPDPALFFTWYCEKAREIEKNTGSVELSLQLLDLALANVSGSRIARRFITATKGSLLRFRTHLLSLAAKLERPDVSGEDKAAILATLKTIDLREFEKRTRSGGEAQQTSRVVGARGEQSDQATAEGPKRFGPDASTESDASAIPSADWTLELSVLDLILQEKFDEAFSVARQTVFFPTALLELHSKDPLEWLQGYCTALVDQCSIRADDEAQVPEELCDDPWTATVNEQLGISRQHTDEQTLQLVLAKARMATTLLHHVAMNRPASSTDVSVDCDEADMYF